MSNSASAPTPDLRIVPTASLFPHEEHDSQRSAPLVERLRNESAVINPPVVAPIDDHNFVILDGANRCHAFEALGYPHIIVQVAPYENGQVDLLTWKHVVGSWRGSSGSFVEAITEIPGIALANGHHASAQVHITLRDDDVVTIHSKGRTLAEQNAALCAFVRIYQQRARLHRTALDEPDDVWDLYDDALALVTFPSFTPQDILTAAQAKAYLPPGVSRHIIQGRALRLNYPLERLRDGQTSLATKNADLREWFQQKLANRQVRFYAESTYQFDE